MAKPSPNDEAPLRADAQLNRSRILEAAEAVFLEQGAGASLDDVAKRAKVGIGTLYRRFPTRESLLAATSDAKLLTLAESSRARDELLDPGSAVRLFLQELVAHASHYRGLATLLGAVLKSETPGCHACHEESERLLRRAQKANAVVRDVTLDDLVCVVTAISLAVQDNPSKQRIAHLVAVFFDGIGGGAPAANELAGRGSRRR